MRSLKVAAFCLAAATILITYSAFKLISAVNPRVDQVSRQPASANHLNRRYGSDFDILMERLEGKFPFPLSRLVETLSGPEKLPVSTVIIPFSLSPHSPSIDYQQPRILVGWLGSASQRRSLYRDLVGPQVFLSYTPKLNQLEIISYNIRDGETEFRVVKDYGENLSPRVFLANQVSCQSCHQLGSAIFPASPWSTTQNNPIVRKRLRESQDLDSLGRSALDAEMAPKVEAEVGANVGTGVSRNVATFDGLIKQFNRLRNIRKSCRSACGDDLNCKREIVAAALFSGREDGAYGKYITKGRLARFDNIHQTPFRGFSGSIDDYTPDKSGNFSLKNVTSLVFPREPDDVATLFHNAGSTHARSCFNFSRADRDFLKVMPFDGVMKALNSTAMTNFLKSHWTHSAVQLIEVVKNPDLVVPASTAMAFQAARPEGGDAKSLGEIENPTAQKLFQRYCASCHTPTSDPAIQLPLDHLTRLAKYRGRHAKHRLKEFLERRAMPPAGALQPSEAEREMMIRSLVD